MQWRFAREGLRSPELTLRLPSGNWYAVLGAAFVLLASAVV